MPRRFLARIVPACLFATLVGAAIIPVSGAQDASPAPLTINSGRITIDGNSNVHEWTASTTKVRVTRAQVAVPLAGPDVWASLTMPGALEGFEIAIPAASLSSPKEGLDKNMYKALKVTEHPDITFKLLRLEPGAADALKAVGTLRIAGVEREVAFELQTARTNGALTVKGSVDLLMTDYGIKPPKAMLGMLKTDPKVKVTFETVLGVPLT